MRKKLTKKFQKHLRVIQNSEMDDMDLKRGTVQPCSDFGSRACVISTVGQEAHVLEIQDHRELMMMRSSPSPTYRLKRHILQIRSLLQNIPHFTGRIFYLFLIQIYKRPRLVIPSSFCPQAKINVVSSYG